MSSNIETDTPTEKVCPVTGELFNPKEGHSGPDGILVSPFIRDSHVWSNYESRWLDREEAVFCEDQSDYYLEEDVIYLEPDNTPSPEHGYWVEYPVNDNTTAWDRRSLVRFDGSWYTRFWIQENTFVCDECGNRHDNDDYDSDGRCRNCAEPASPSAIRDYSCREAATYPSETKDSLRFGIEMETEVAGDVDEADAAEAVASSFPPKYAILKEDGSLDSGFEIVTRPDSLKVHRRILMDSMSKFPSGLRAWKNGRCGMHIHVSRKPMSGLQQGKILVFVNHPSNNDFIVNVAGRSSDQWARRYRKKHSDAKCTLSDSRYEAVNLTPQTLEFRIFRGTIRRETAVKNLEFVAALVAFCNPAATSISDATSHKAFCQFVRKHRKEYPNLDAWLADHNWLPALSQKPAGV